MIKRHVLMSKGLEIWVKDKHTVLGAQSAKGMLGVLGWEGMLGEDT